MSDDIVARLRTEECACECAAAADEIERLRKEHDEAEPLLEELWKRRTDATEMRAEIERLHRDYSCICKEMLRMMDERDEARRAMCKDEAMLRLQRNRAHRDSEEVVRMAKEIAVERGWDCFKEDT